MVPFKILLLASLAYANAVGYSHDLSEIYQFPNGTWVENIAVRPNGNLLVSFVNKPELWETIPSTTSGNTSARLVHHFDGAESVNGIAELTSDVYAVIASNSVWKIDLSGNSDASNPSHIARLPAGTLNGMATLNDGGRSVIISDSELGLVWRLNTHTRNYTVILQDETMEPTRDLGLLLGINGPRILADHVYYNNSPKRLFCRVPIDIFTGLPLGSYEVISRDVLADDFAISSNGVGYLAGLTENIVTRVFANGTHEVIAGALNSTKSMTATSAAFGRTKNDYQILYVTTGGESEHPVNRTDIKGGKVMALSIDS